RRLVHPNQRMSVVVLRLIHVEDFFHLGDEPRPVLLRNAKPLAAPRLQPIFFRHCRTVSRHTLVTTCNRHNSSTNSCNVQRVRPSGGVEQHSVTRRASAAPSNLGGSDEGFRGLRFTAGVKPSTTNRRRMRIT